VSSAIWRAIGFAVAFRICDKIHRVYNGLDLSISPRLSRQTGAMLSIGRLIEKKGFKFLIEAAVCSRSYESVFLPDVGDDLNMTDWRADQEYHYQMWSTDGSVAPKQLVEIFAQSSSFVSPQSTTVR